MNEDDRMAAILEQVMGLVSGMDPWVEASKAYKQRMMAEGFGEEAADRMAADFHHAMMSSVHFGGS